MTFVFTIIDKSERIIHLSHERGNHITTEHPEITNVNLIIDALTHPNLIKRSHYDERVRWYYREHKPQRKYLFVSVKYLNGHGFVITAYFVRNIK